MKTAKERNAFLANELDISLAGVEQSLIDGEAQIHCENVIGAVSIPMGVAGPLDLNGEELKGQHYIPLATTEGALVASVSRGCKAITESGGASVYAYATGTTRGPVFYTETLERQKLLYKWIQNNKNKLAEEATKTSSHLTFKDVMVKATANYLFARFIFDTDEAMGMNMVTIATQKMVELIEQETGISCLSVAGNFDIDKKPAWLNFINNRGRKAWAEAVIKKEVIESVLKTTAEKIFDVWLGKCMIGSIMSGSLGFNCHYANVIAAFYAATGQDLAHVVEGSMGVVTTKVVGEGDLYISAYIPALMLGTVGGGTKLQTQTEARSITGCTTAAQLAELLSGAVLAGELSLLASLSQHTLAKAHSKLGR